MNNLTKYLTNNQIKHNLTPTELKELKTLLEKEEEEFFQNRSKECYLFEINEKLEK